MKTAVIEYPPREVEFADSVFEKCDASRALNRLNRPLAKPLGQLNGSNAQTCEAYVAVIELLFSYGKGSRNLPGTWLNVTPFVLVETPSPAPAEKKLPMSDADRVNVKLCAEFQSLGRTKSVAIAVVVAPAELLRVTVPVKSAMVLLFAWDTVMAGIRVPSCEAWPWSV